MLTLDEAAEHPQLKARATYAQIDGITQPMPAPRFSRSVPDTPKPFRPWDPHQADEILGPWLDSRAIGALKDAGIID